jgi:hypothetical protein
MNKACCGVVLAVALLAIMFPVSSLGDQSDKMTMSPAVCEALQQQVDEVVAVGNSTTLSDEEKISRLSASIEASFATMLRTTKDSPEAAKIAQQWLKMLSQVTAAANTAKDSGTQSVTPDAKRGLDIARNRVKPYLAIMKMLCPNLKVPDSLLR